ncbi:MAG: SRPBCC family protein [Actinomycetes bacterium]
MQLEHEFVVPVPVDQAWDVLLDVERIAPCMPGATVESFDGETVHGRVKVKVGPIQVTYSGTAKFVEKDEATRSVKLDASGKEARGSGTAKATIVAVLQDQGGSTKVTVSTDLAVTGKPAQFGRGVMVEVGNKLLGRFADCLAEEIGAGEAGRPAPAEEAIAPLVAPAATPALTAAAPAPALTTASAAPAAESSVPAAPPTPSVTEAATPTPEAPPAVAAPPRPFTRSPDNEAIDLLDVGGAAVAKRLAPLVVGLIVLVVVWRLLRRRS